MLARAIRYPSCVPFAGWVEVVATEGSAHSRSRVVGEILRYLMEHPDAKDTVDGIARWWIRPQGEGWQRHVVQDAIDELVARGFVVRRETTSSHVVYGLDKQHLETITHIVRSESPCQ